MILDGRTFTKDGSWNTLCLPFPLPERFLRNYTPLAGAIIKEMDESSSLSDDGVLTLKFRDTKEIVAGKAYLVKWTEGKDIVNPVFPGVPLDDAAPIATESTDGKVKFVGQYSPFAIDESNINEILFVGSKNMIGYSKNPRNLKTFRAHFWVKPNVNGSLAARSVTLDFGDGETTSINLVDADNKSDTANGIFTLDGRKLQGEPTKKGIYIINGKKVVK